MPAELIHPDWPAHVRVRALATTRRLGDMKSNEGRRALRAHLPADPLWLRQVHGIRVLDAAQAAPGDEGDASFTTRAGVVCVAMAADCLPVLLADEGGEVVAAAHAGWRGLCAGVLEATVREMGVPPARLMAWLGPAIGPVAYEVGAEVREAFLRREAAAAAAFSPTRPGHWTLDLVAVARGRLAGAGVGRVFGGGFCTASDTENFFSYRRDKARERLVAAIWLT